MAKRCFVPKRFKPQIEAVIEKCNEIIASYQAQGYLLSLRQLYYQMVSRALIPNNVKEYDKLGIIVNDARLAGLIDWDAIEDRGRYVRSRAHWDSPATIVDACAEQFHVDLWEGQTYRPEVWVEKDALVGVLEGPCNRLDVPFFSCRGYNSVTALYEASQRMLRHGRQTPVIIHLGDHDPSGIDMTRDICDRLAIFGVNIEVDRVALNMDQVEEYNPPPNPAKLSDSRCQGYMLKYGDESWELDALEPAVLDQVISTAVEKLIDQEPWQAQLVKREEGRERLRDLAEELRGE